VKTIVSITLGSIVGAALRDAITHAPGELAPHWRILIANLLGCALIGFFSVPLPRFPIDEARRRGLTTGLCGGLTTFSFLSWHTLQLGGQTSPWHVAGYLLLTLAAGITLTAVTFQATRNFAKPK